MTALDPDDFAYNDEQEHMDREGHGEEQDPTEEGPLLIEQRPDGRLGLVGEDEETCPHSPADRLRDDDGTQVCTACGKVIEHPGEAEPVPREGPADWIEPAEPQSGEGVLKHIPWPPGTTVRPYTPEDVEHEILAYVARLNSGARFQAGKEQELREAEIEFELRFARALIAADGKSAETRKAQAIIACEEEWVRLTILKQVVQTTRNGMHTLRQQLTGLQSVGRSVSQTAGSGPSGRQFQ